MLQPYITYIECKLGEGLLPLIPSLISTFDCIFFKGKNWKTFENIEVYSSGTFCKEEMCVLQSSKHGNNHNFISYHCHPC
jgi:hypothetical protein